MISLSNLITWQDKAQKCIQVWTHKRHTRKRNKGIYLHKLCLLSLEILVYGEEEPVYPTVNTMAVDDLVTQGARASAAMILT